jgi:hypothetical protein
VCELSTSVCEWGVVKKRGNALSCLRLKLRALLSLVSRYSILLLLPKLHRVLHLLELLRRVSWRSGVRHRCGARVDGCRGF